MNNFKEFIDEIKKSPSNLLPESNIALPRIQLALTRKVGGFLAPSLVSSDDQQKFSEEVSSLVQDETFISELSQQIGEPQEHESEDEFVKCSSDELRKMLYKKFGIKS